MMLFTVPILLPFYLSIGLQSGDVFIIQAVFAFTVALLDVPAGYIADLVGRKRILIIGSCITFAGFFLYTQVHSFTTVIISEMLLAVGFSLRSGIKEATIYDSLLLLQEQSSYQKKQGIAGSIGFISEGISCVLGGVLATISLRLPFYVQLISVGIALIIACTLVEPSRTRPKQNHLSNFKKAFFQIYLKDKRIFWSSLLFGSISAITFCAVWLSQVLYANLGLPTVWFGIGFATGSFVISFGNFVSHKLQRHMSEKWQYIAIMVIVIIGFVGMGINSLFAIVFTLAPRLAWGILTPLSLEVTNRITESELRVTILSIKNMSERIIYVILAPLLSYAIGAHKFIGALFGLSVLMVAIGSIALVKTQRSGALR